MYDTADVGLRRHAPYLNLYVSIPSLALLLVVVATLLDFSPLKLSLDTMADAQIDADAYTWPFQLTKAMHRDVYPAIDPTNQQLSAESKTVLITGGGGTLGKVCHTRARQIGNLY